MNVLKDPKCISICMQCNQRIINYPNQLCRKQFLRINKYSKIRNVHVNQENKIESGNLIIDEFIKETQLNSKCCDDFIEWISRSNLENIKYLTFGGNSKIYSGTWKLNRLSTNIALKVTGDSDNISDNILNELKIHHKCRGQNIIPFYGITKSPEGDEYAMIIRHAKHGDLRNYIRKFFPKLTWTNKVKILIELSKALNSLHQMNILHKDFHCKNILVDEDDRIFLSDFGLCQPIDSEKGLALSVLDGLRPNIVEGTPDFYTNIMKQCWDSDPLKRPDASLLPKIFEEMIELCKMTDDNTVSTIVAFNSLSSYIDSEHGTKTFNSEKKMMPNEDKYETKAYEYSLEYEAKVHEYSETKAHEYPLEYRTEAYEYSLELPHTLQGPPPPPLPLQASNQHSQYFQATQPPPPPPQKVVQPTHNNSLPMSAPPAYPPSNVYLTSTTPSNNGYQFPQQQQPNRTQSSQYPQKFVENQSIYSSSLPLQPPAQGFSSAPPAYPPSNVYPPSTTPSNDGYQFQQFQQQQQQFSGPDRNQSSQYPQKFVENQSIYSSSLPLQPPAQGFSSAPPAYPPSNVYPPSTTPSNDGYQFQQFQQQQQQFSGPDRNQSSQYPQKFVENQSIYSSSLPLQPPAQGFSSVPPAYPPSNVYPPSTTPSNDGYQFQQFQQQQQQFSGPDRNQSYQYPQKFVENQSIYSSSLPLQPPAQGPLYPPAYPPSNVYPPSTTPSYGCQFQQFSNPNRKQSSQYPPVLSTNAYPPLFRMPQHLQANSNVYPPPNYSNNYSSKFSNVYPPHPSSSSNFYPPNSTLSRPPQFFDSNRIQSPVSSQYLPVSSSTNAYPSPLPLPFQRSRLPETSQLTKSSRYRYQMENVDNNRTEDPRYNTQTYAFSLDHLNKAYNELINNRSII
ncbi:uncharacterized protein OCT59_022312 [Rhizophagus irregularis]|uniref:uncharacterized protein n=1 Tax=Rhizophagus irregularis TaxID=588596 RepID=UPI003322E88B|nr:hypothetical protein OCT59_022312 [Rhizophagus irregularis]